MELLSNWGDESYIGLNAIEVFSENGKRVEVEEVRETDRNKNRDIETDI